MHGRWNTSVLKLQRTPVNCRGAKIDVNTTRKPWERKRIKYETGFVHNEMEGGTQHKILPS